MALAFAGTADFGAAILRGLIDPPAGRDRREVALVISQPDRPAGRGKKLRSPAVATLAREHDLPLLQPESISDPSVDAVLREHGVTTIVVAAFGQLIREPMLTDYLMINVHGSLLPAYRGAAPIERSIMHGLSETGVGIMRMDAGLDTGPVALEATIAIGLDDDAGEIYARAADAGVRLLHQALDAADEGTLKFVHQNDEGATYAHKITAADRELDFHQSARSVHDTVRALSPHIGAFCEIDGARVTLWKTTFSNSGGLEPGQLQHDTQTLRIGCADGQVEVLEVQPAGKRRMPVGDWLRGLREPLTGVSTPSPQA